MMGNAKLLDDRVPEDNKAVPRPFASSKLAVLRKHPYFCDLDPEAFDQLCRYAKHSTLKRGATIVSRGDPGNSLIAVISGTVKISVSSADGRSAILNLIGPGEIFGEVAVLDGLARTADATANTNCEIFVIHRREFIPFVRSQPESGKHQQAVAGLGSAQLGSPRARGDRCTQRRNASRAGRSGVR